MSDPSDAVASLSAALPTLLAQAHVPALASEPASTPFPPLLILILCAVAGVGTVLLLPTRREAAFRKIGGTILTIAALIFAALLARWTSGSSTGGMNIYFWIFSAIAIFGAARVITHPRPVYSALYFVMTVFASAGLFLLLWAEFMAVALIIIYAGAILITYVFVIMLASEATNATAGQTGSLAGLSDHDAVSREPFFASAVGFLLMGVILFVVFDKAQPIARHAPLAGDTGAIQSGDLVPVSVSEGSTIQAASPQSAHTSIVHGGTQKLGEYLFKNHMISLELAGLILTVAMVGAIMIARRNVIVHGEQVSSSPEVVVGPATPLDDNPHSIPVYGTNNPRQKEYPEA